MSPHYKALVLSAGLCVAVLPCLAQIDSMHRNLLQLGYDNPIGRQGPHGLYAYYYYSNPEIHGTNTALRLAVSPAYLDGEVGFKQLISPSTDVGIGFNGGGFNDSYYEVRQGNYLKTESFDGYGGGAALSLYQLLNPGMLIPLSAIARAGARYTTYDDTDKTAATFEVPNGRVTGFTRAGLRFAGKEPVLFPDLGLELSVWYERQWRSEHDAYGFGGDRQVDANAELYWLYAGLNYAWTNTGHQASFAVTAGGSEDTDRFSAWRLGGVLPLVAEFPLMMPGYYYQELTAKNFVHLYASYLIPLDEAHRFQLRLEAAGTHVDYLEGFAQDEAWQTGVGAGLTFTPKNRNCRIVLRYGYGFNAICHNGNEGAHSVGLLFQFDFEQFFDRRHNPQ